MTTDPDNPLNITDEDIGKEGRFTWRGDPCVVLRKLRGRASPAVTIAYENGSGSKCTWTARLGDARLVRIPVPPRKLYIAVAKEQTCQIYGASCAYLSREALLQALGGGDNSVTIIEIPHPEDAP